MKNIEEHIRRAMDEGEFEDLPGKGKPLRMNDNPFDEPEWRLAHHLLESNGYTLPWIEKRKEIDAALSAARAGLSQAWEWRRSRLTAAQRSSVETEAEWRRAIEAFRLKIDEINKDIFSYNLQAPVTQVQMLSLKAEREIEKITTP